MDKYRSESQQKTLAIMIRLAGHEKTGLAPGEIAKATGIPNSNVTRALANLRIAGLAEQVPGMEGRWRLGPKLIQIGLAYTRAIERLRAEVDELEQRYTRDPS